MGAEAEEELARLHSAGDHAALATALVDRYAGEILGFMVALMRDEDRAQDAFQSFCEDLLKGLPAFRGDASFRTWLYVIARRRVEKANRQRPTVPLSRSPEVERLVAESRSRTAPHLRTEVKSSMRRLREQLTEDEQALLILRVDRGLSWKDIAEVLGDDASAPAAARVRKRFQRTKDRLQALAEAEGLLPGAES